MRRYILKFTPLWLLISIREVWRHNAPQNATRASVLSSHPHIVQDVMILLRDTWGRSPNPYNWQPLGAVTEPVQLATFGDEFV